MLALLATVGWQGSLRDPLGPAAGTELFGRAPALPALEPSGEFRLRLGTFNIHGCRGRDGRYDVERVANCLRELDFVGLNEVHGPNAWHARNHAQELGEQLDMAWLFAPTEERWWHDRFGNGLLCRYPVASWQRIPLARVHGKSFRNLLHVRMPVGDRILSLVVTHVDRSDDLERAEQLRIVGDFFLSLAAPAVLMGDMNTEAIEPALARLLATPGVHDPLADVQPDPPRRIDWILTRGLTTLDAGLVNDGASDHPHVWAELSLPAD